MGNCVFLCFACVAFSFKAKVYGFGVDVWALAVTCLEVRRAPPLHTGSAAEWLAVFGPISATIAGQLHWSVPRELLARGSATGLAQSWESWAFLVPPCLSRACSYDPRARPTASELCAELGIP